MFYQRKSIKNDKRIMPITKKYDAIIEPLIMQSYPFCVVKQECLKANNSCFKISKTATGRIK